MFTQSRRPCTLLQGISRVNRAGVIFVFALALAIRLAFLSQISRFPLFFTPVGDPEGYALWARGIAGGDWLGSRVFYQAPLYPYFLGLIYALKPLAAAGPHLIQALLDAAACALVAGAGRIFFNRTAGLLAGLILCIYPMNLFFLGLLQKSTLTFFLFSLLLYLLALCEEKPSRLRWLFSGAALGLLTLCRENALALFPLLMLWLFVHFAGASRRRLLGWYLALLAGLFCVLFPVALRNKAVGGAFVLTTSQFGANFYYGNHAGATGIYEPLSWGRASWRFEQDDARLIAEEDLGRKLSPQQVNRYWTKRALADIKSSPSRWIRLMAFKSLLVLNHLELGDSQDVYTQSGWSGLLRAGLLLLPFPVLLGLAGFGLAATWQERRRLWILMALFLAFWGSVALFFFFDRYRFPMAALLALFAGGGLAALPSLFRERRWAAAGIGLLLFLLLFSASRKDLVYANLLTANTWRNMAVVAEEKGDFPAAERYFARAIADNPLHAKALEEYGELLERRGRTEDARAMLERALAARPDFAEAHWALGMLDLRQEDFAAAAGHFLAVSREPRFRARAYDQLGRIALASGNAEGIADMARKQTAEDPQWRESLPELISILDSAARIRRERAMSR